RILIPSPKVATYDLQPEMSAPEVTDALCAQLITEKHHLCILNFANPDMVGHTGVMEAAISAVETIDTQLKKVVETATRHGYKILVIADHGNADCMVKEDGSPHTAHTTALVPAMIINEEDIKEMHDGILADVAPTLLKLMGVKQPEEMTGKPLY
ncbi:MAG TPA: alkaline phosphatase family protein, partial [Halalkalibaculum sp.]|nr:alkaline phosphatase family protein [Halalkalibaculum sp.]